MSAKWAPGHAKTVPLSPQAVALLKQIHALTGVSDLVFAGDAKPWKPMSENTVNSALRKMGYDTKIEICAHGLRSIAFSALIESGLWSETAIERQTSHKEPQQRPRRLHPQGRVHRGAQADHELVEPVSGGQPAGACHST
jgi:integrase